MGKPRKKDINMAKNMTRKGLAFGAGLALIGSTFAALPAQASTVTLSPSAGTSYNTLTSSTFKLMPVLTGLSSADYKYLRYKVTNGDAVAFNVDIEQGTTTDGESLSEYGTTVVASDTSYNLTVPSAVTLTVAADAGTTTEVASATNDTVTLKAPTGSFVANDYVIAADLALTANTFDNTGGGNDETAIEAFLDSAQRVTSVATAAIDVLTFTADATLDTAIANSEVAFGVASGSAVLQTVKYTSSNGFTEVHVGANVSNFSVGDVVHISSLAATGVTSGILTAINGFQTITGKTGRYIEFTIATSLTDDIGVTTAGTIRNMESPVYSDNNFVVMPHDTASGANASAIGSQNYLKLSPVVLNTTAVATVQAWIDGNQNNTIDAGEITSAAQTVTWKPVGTLSATVGVDSIYAAATSVVAHVTFSGDINYQQIDSGDVTTTLTQTTDASGSGALSGATADTAVAWNSVTSRFESTDGSLGNVASADVFQVIVEVDNNYDSSINNTKATASSTVATTVADPTFEANVVNSATAVNTQSSRSDTGSGDVADFATRAGTGSVVKGSTGFDVKVFVGTDAVIALGINGAVVSASVTGGTVTATDAVTVGGKALVTGAATVLNLKTDSVGYVTIPVTLGAADDDDTLTFAFSAYGSSLSSSDLVVTVTDNGGDYSLTQTTPGDLTIEAGDTVAIDYKIVDLFGANVTNGTHSVLFAPTSQTRTTAATWSLSVPVVNGAVSLSVVDNGVGVGSFTVNAKLVTNGTTSALSAGTVNIVVNVVADKDAATIVAQTLTYGALQATDANNDGDYADTGDTDNTAALLLENKTFSNYDSRYNVPTVSAPVVVDGNKVVVGGKVANAAGTAIDGAPVTFAANGFLFFDGTSYAMNSITVHTASTGIASVSAWSSVGGAQSVTMTSGTITASQALVYAAGTGTAATFTVTSPAYSAAGTTADVTVTATDKYGNPAKGVSVTLYSTGPGYLINTTGTTLTNGTFSTKLLLGSNDSGSATVSAVMTIGGVETTQTATITVGTAPAADAKVNVGSFKGYVALYAKGYKGSKMTAIVAGKWIKVDSLASDFERVVRYTGAGYDIVTTIYIDGVMIETFNVTTK